MNSLAREDLRPPGVPDNGPPRAAQHIVFYRRDAFSYEKRCELEEARASTRLALAEPWLNASNGECGLTDHRTASNLAFAIRMSPARYGVLAWCIMPSHVHVLMAEHPNTDLIAIVGSWMASAEVCGVPVSRSATFLWDTRFFAEAGRGNDWIAAVRRRIEATPVTAGLAASPGSWRWSSASKDLAPLRPERRTGRATQAPMQTPLPVPAQQQEQAQPQLAPPLDPARRAAHVIFWLDDALPLGLPHKLARCTPGRRLYLLDKALDAGRGRRSLTVRAAATQVRNEILSGDGVRYGLIAWCVMPTHVHVLFSEVAGFPPADLVARWKSNTVGAAVAKRIFKNGAAGWAKAYSETEIVGGEEVEDVKSYIEYNPVITGLDRNPHTWPWSSATATLVNAGRS